MRLFCCDSQSRSGHPSWRYGVINTAKPIRTTAGRRFPDIYISDQLDQAMKEDPWCGGTLFFLIQKIIHSNMVIIPDPETYAETDHSRTSDGKLRPAACYDTNVGMIWFEFLFDRALFYLDGEPIDTIRKEHDEMAALAKGLNS